MEDPSKHPLESQPNAAIPTQPKKLNIWFVMAIVFLVVAIGLPVSAASGMWQFIIIVAGFCAFVGMTQILKFGANDNPAILMQLTDFELAQRRLKERGRKRTLMLVWLGIFSFLIVVNILFGGYVAGGLIPFMLFTLFMAGFYGLQTYYSEPQKIVDRMIIEKEMGWLFGEHWQDHTSSVEYTFAQDRIRKRRRDRWLFVFHLLVYLPVTAFALYGTFDFAVKYEELSLQPLCLSVPILWTIFLLLPHGLQAFPTDGMLARRERKVARKLQAEIDSMHPDKLKNDEKSKRGVHYVVGDDGELEEVEDEINVEDAKPKRMMRDGE